MRPPPTSCRSPPFVLALATAATVAVDRFRGDGDVVRAAGYAPYRRPRPTRRMRVMFPVQEPPGAPHVNTMISLSHNWDWSAEGGWRRDDPGQPSVALTVESWFRGLAELNFDMEPPQSQAPAAPAGAWPGGRAMGLAARYDGSFAILQVGGPPYRAGAAGVALIGGVTADPVVTVNEAEGGRGEALRVQRPNGESSVSLLGGASPALAFGLAGRPADAVDVGVLRIAGAPAQGPIINLAGNGFSPILDGADCRARSGAELPHRRRRPARMGQRPRTRRYGARPHRAGALRGARRARGDRAAGRARLDPAEHLGVLARARARRRRAHSTGDQMVRVSGLPDGGVVLVNGPEQPAGLGVAGARMQGRERLAIRFFNVGAEPGGPPPAAIFCCWWIPARTDACRLGAGGQHFEQ